MRFARKYVAVASLLSLFVSFPLPARQSSPASTTTPQRDPQAVAAIQQAIAAMGGQNAAAQIQTVVAQATLTPTRGSADPLGSVVFEDAFTSQGHEFKDSFRSANLVQSFVSGHGAPGVVSNARIRKFTPHIALFRQATHLPIVLLSQVLANANCSIEFVGSTNLNGVAAIQIHLHVDTDILQQTLSVQDWYFDPVTGLPLRMEYRLPDSANALYFVPAACDFSDFRPVQGILFPFRIVSYRDGIAQNTLSFDSVSLNQAVASSDFDLAVTVAQ